MLRLLYEIHDNSDATHATSLLCCWHRCYCPLDVGTSTDKRYDLTTYPASLQRFIRANPTKTPDRGATTVCQWEV